MSEGQGLEFKEVNDARNSVEQNAEEEPHRAAACSTESPAEDVSVHKCVYEQNKNQIIPYQNLRAAKKKCKATSITPGSSTMHKQTPRKSSQVTLHRVF